MSQDTRKDPRAKIVSLNVRYKSATVDEFIDNHSHDVSKGGLFIKTSSPFPPGTLLKFEIRIAGDKAVIAGVGRVVWKREASQAGPEQPAGMGVKFIKIDDASRTVIDKLIASRGEGEGRNAYDDGVGDGGGAAHAPGQVQHTPAAAAARAPAKPTPMGGTGLGPEATPFRPAPSASKIPVSAGKATMMGIGGIQEAIAGQKTGVAADAERTVARSPAAGRPASDDNERTLSTDHERTVARPSTAERLASEEKPKPAAAARLARPAPASTAPTTAPMFPKSDSKAGMPPKNEQTVMKQAAELLEEALLGAGGSMDEIGQNPLFDVAKDAKDAKDDSNTALDALMKSSSPDDGQSTVQGVGPVDLHALMKPAGEAAAKPPVEAAASAAKATPAKAASAEPAPTLASALRVPSEVDSTLRSAGDEDAGAAPKAKGDSRPPPKASPKTTPSTRPAASAFVADAPESNNKALLWVVGAAAAGVLGYLFYSQISEPSDSDKLVPETPTTVSAPPTALPPEPSASASAAPAESASAAASASAAPAASASTSPAASGSAAVPASASATPPTPPPTPTQAVVAPVVQPRPQPPPRPKPTPPPPATDTETPPAPTEAAPTPRPAPPPPPAPKPKPKPKPEDDNPY